MDDDLRLNGVFFLPWVGEHYGADPTKSRLLILGESHYNKLDEETPDLTRACVREHAARSWNHRFFTMLTQLVTGQDHLLVDRAMFWGGLCFYNYVQRSVGENWGVAPHDADFVRDERAFRSLVARVQPTHVLVCSWRLWDNLPPAIFSPVPRRVIADRYEVRTMSTQPVALAMGIPHPSRSARAPVSGAIRQFLTTGGNFDAITPP